MKFIQRLVISYLRLKFRLLTALSPGKATEKAFDLFCTPQFRNKRELPAIFTEAEKINFRFDLYDISGYRWNKGGEKKVLIIHGFESSAISFDSYVQPLIEKGYEVLAFDAPAHGRSSGTRITVLIFKDFIKYIAQNYGPVESFMAHSFGGLALCLAMEEMDHDENYRVALVAPATETSTALDQFFNLLHLDNKIRQLFEKKVNAVGGHPSSWFSIRRAVGNIRAKIVWFHDEEDQQTPFEDAWKVKEDNHPGIRFVITKGLGHRRIYRDNTVRQAIVDFL